MRIQPDRTQPPPEAIPRPAPESTAAFSKPSHSRPQQTTGAPPPHSYAMSQCFLPVPVQPRCYSSVTPVSPVCSAQTPRFARRIPPSNPPDESNQREASETTPSLPHQIAFYVNPNRQPQSKPISPGPSSALSVTPAPGIHTPAPASWRAPAHEPLAKFTSFGKSLPASERCACSGRPPGSALPLLPCFLWPCARVRAAWCVTPPPE